MVVSLKPVWYFAECFLFVLTGCVIRPAIDAGISTDLFGWFFAVLLLGQLARMTADVAVAVAWHAMLTKSRPTQWSGKQWSDVLRRVAFVWVATIPKATLQASLGPKLSSPFRAAGATSAATFVAPAAAIAILYCATFGSLLTFTVGKSIAVYFQNEEESRPLEGIRRNGASESTKFEVPSTPSAVDSADAVASTPVVHGSLASQGGSAEPLTV